MNRLGFARIVEGRDARVLAAVLRILAAPAFVGRAIVDTSEDDTSLVILAVGVAAYGLLTLVLARRESTWPIADRVLPVLDVVVAVLIVVVALDAARVLIWPFLFAPVTTAIQLRPLATAGVSALAVGAFVVLGLDAGASAEQVLARAGPLLWVCAALVVLAALIDRRETRLEELLRLRGLLVAEALDVEERARGKVAVDLHDGPLQSVIAARLELEGIADPPAAVVRASSSLQQATRRLRGAVAELHPQVVEHAGLARALAQLGEEMAARGPAVVVDAEDGPADAHDVFIFRAAGELIRNAIEHGAPRRVDVALRRPPGHVELVVADDGGGFDPRIVEARVREGHIGLASIRERALALGGEVRLDSAPGRGARVAVALPDAGIPPPIDG